MIPNPEHIAVSFDAIDTLVGKNGWDQQPHLLLLQEPSPEQEGTLRNAIGVPTHAMVPLLARPLPVPDAFVQQPAAALAYMAENYAWPVGQWRDRPILPPEVTDLVDAHFAGLMLCAEAYVTIARNLPEHLSATFSYLTGRQEVRIIHAVDTAGWGHMFVRFRASGTSLTAHSLPDGRIYESHLNNGALAQLNLDGGVQAAMRIIVAALCRRHMHPVDHEMPPIPGRKVGTGREAFDHALTRMFPRTTE